MGNLCLIWLLPLDREKPGLRPLEKVGLNLLVLVALAAITSLSHWCPC